MVGGVTPGWPDIEVVVPQRLFLPDHAWSPIYVELKSSKGDVSQKQAAVIAALIEAGAHVCVCRSVSEVANYLSRFVALDCEVA